jgi:drug/metabolite transporter (DMT)-like permease
MKQQQSDRHEHLAILAMMVSAAIWGSGFIATRMAIDAGFGAAWILIGRFSIATLVFGILFRREVKRASRRDLLVGLPVGLFLFLGFWFQTLGLGRTTPARNAFITATYVVIVPLLGWLLTRRRPAWRIFVGAVASLSGIALLSLGGQTSTGTWVGDGLTLLCAVCFAVHFIALEWAVHRIGVGLLLVVQMAVTTLCALLLLPQGGAQTALPAFASPDWLTGAGALLYLAIFSSGLAYAIQTTAQKYTTSAKAAIVLAAEALWGSVFSLLLGYEPLTSRLVVGGLIITFSILLVEWPFQPARLPTPSA